MGSGRIAAPAQPDSNCQSSNKMKLLLTITAILEGVTGLALVIRPSLIVSLLLGVSLTNSTATSICRLLGAILFIIAIACWLARNNRQSSVMVKVMLAYNIISIILLVYAALVEKIYGPVLWPAVLLHLVLLIWCVSSLQKRMQKVV